MHSGDKRPGHEKDFSNNLKKCSKCLLPEARLHHCRAGINVASILADGSISACPNLRANFIQGNIYKDNLRDVWEKKYSLFRERNWTKTGLCADCKFFKYCEGNGMHLRDEKTGELLFCHLKRIREGEQVLLEG